jgi:hypothetical protein
MKKYLFIVLALFLMANIAMAADSTNASSTTILEGDTWLIYYGTITTGSDSTANHHSSAFYIGEANLEYGGLQIYFTNIPGTEDANGILGYSNDPAVDLTYFNFTTYPDLDQISTTVKWAKVGAPTDSTECDFKEANWMVIKLDGQAGHPAGAVANFFLYLHKKEGARNRNVGRVKSTT